VAGRTSEASELKKKNGGERREQREKRRRGKELVRPVGRSLFWKHSIGVRLRGRTFTGSWKGGGGGRVSGKGGGYGVKREGRTHGYEAVVFLTEYFPKIRCRGRTQL